MSINANKKIIWKKSLWLPLNYQKHIILIWGRLFLTRSLQKLVCATLVCIFGKYFKVQHELLFDEYS